MMRERVVRRLLPAGLCALLALGVGGCAGIPSVEPEQTPGTDTQKMHTQAETGELLPAWERLAGEKEDITLDWYINYSWYATDWGGNVVSDTITKETGVSINFVTPMGSESEKLNALIASDSLPDLITLGYWEPQLAQMISSGMVYPLNELADLYDPYFWEVSDEIVVNWYTQEDGNIYAYPNSSVTPKDFEENKKIGSNETFLVRKDIYEAIGSPDMSTTEGFYEAVKKAAEMFPEVDGQPLIPVGSHVFDGSGCVSFDKYLLNFLAIDQERDGRAYDRYTDPEYIKWLKMFRRLGAEGYLANDIFVDTRTQMEEKIAQGRYFCMLYQYSDMLAQQKTLYGTNPDKVYTAVEGPRNANGADPTLPVSGVSGWTVTLISKKCKDPERAIAFMDYLMSEHGQMLTYLGVENVTYEMVDGRPVLYDSVRELLDTDRLEYDRIYGADDAYWMLQDNVMQQQWLQEVSPAVEQLSRWAYKYAVYDGQYDYFFPSGSREAEIDHDIDKLWSETLPKLLLAPDEAEFDRVFGEFVKAREQAGFEQLMEAKIQYMTEAKKRLGISK